MHIIGKSQFSLNTRGELKLISKKNINVLITGEKNCGKKTIAKIIHENSKTKKSFHTTINCLDQDLNLFKIFNSLNFYDDLRHTILISEIENLSLFKQKILYQLILELFSQVASIYNAKVRFTTTSNQKLSALVRNKKFLLDLYLILNESQISVPPLRKRKDDFESFVKYFLYNDLKFFHVKINKETISILKNYSWPGNLKELKNYLLNLIIKTKSNIIKPENLLEFELDINKYYCPQMSLSEMTKNFQKDLITTLLIKNNGNKNYVSKILKISRTSVYNKIGL